MMRAERRRRSPAPGPLRGGTDVEHGALGARCDSERRPRERRRFGRQAIDVVIRVRGVVVKRHQVPDIRQPGERQRVLERAVPPADVRQVFGETVLASSTSRSALRASR
jgi:hypothetical protein